MGDQVGTKFFMVFASFFVLLVVILIVVAYVKGGDEIGQLRESGEDVDSGFFDRVLEGLDGNDAKRQDQGGSGEGLSDSLSAFKTPLSMDFLTFPLSKGISNKETLLSINEPIVGLTVDLNAILDEQNSFARVILVDDKGNEYLVYQVGWPFEEDTNLKAVCEETCLLDPAVVPVKLVIEVSNDSSSLIISSINYVLESEVTDKGITKDEIKKSKDDLKKLQKDIKIKKLNDKEISWIAGDTPVCGLSYSDRKKLFDGEVGNSCGFECYKSGVFSFCEEEVVTEGEKTVPFDKVIFDYRNRHGVSWHTPVKAQGQCGSCYAFGSVAALEGVINLQYNQHIDVDLSEQQVLSCTGGCSGGWHTAVYQFVQYKGVVSESMMPYEAKAGICNDSTTLNPYEWKITNYKQMNDATNRDVFLRQELVNRGPLAMAGPQTWWAHLTALSGYGYDQNGPYWIVKNSWGDWGDDGYGKIRITSSYLDPANTLFAYVNTPIPPSTESYTKLCEDKDKDGYCNWGIGAKPSSCSSSCAVEPDCDDSQSGIGVCTTEKLLCGDKSLIKSGESLRFGSYRQSYELGCCGDNVDEFAINGACCNSAGDYVVDGKCTNSFVDVKINSGYSRPVTQDNTLLVSELNQRVYFSASATVSGQTCSQCTYSWYKDGVFQVGNGSSYEVSFYDYDTHNITVRATDITGGYGEKAMQVKIGMNVVSPKPIGQFTPFIYGDKTVWMETTSPNEDVYLYDFITNSTTKVSPSTLYHKDQSPTLYVSPSGYIAGYQTVVSSSMGWNNVTLYKQDGTRTIVGSKNHKDSKISLNGNKLVYVENKTSLILYDVNAGTRFVVSNDSSLKANPSLSGNYITWDQISDGNRDIYLYDISLGATTRITTDDAEQSNPFIFEGVIVWQDSRDGNKDIYGYNIPSSLEFLISDDDGDQINPKLNGNYIVWQSMENGNWDIYLCDLSKDGEIYGCQSDDEKARITNDVASQVEPSVYGNRLVWADNRTGISQVYSANIVLDYVCGDMDRDKDIDQADLDDITGFAFEFVTIPSGVNADINNDGVVNIFDVTILTNYLKRNGSAPIC